MNVQAYLDRICYSGSLDPTLSVLAALQQAHLYTVPFENLDIHTGTPISLDLDRFYDKVVSHRRGGFCYELNSLFGELLRALGFEVKVVSARVYTEEKGYGPEFDHLTLILRVGEMDYMCDVGFGEFAGAPLRIVMDEDQQDPRGVYRIERHDEVYLRVSVQKEEGWIPSLLFTLEPRELADFTAMCHSQQHAADSHFRSGKMCSLATPNGRISMWKEKLKITYGKRVSEIEVPSEHVFRAYLKQYMGIQIHKPFIQLSS